MTSLRSTVEECMLRLLAKPLFSCLFINLTLKRIVQDCLTSGAFEIEEYWQMARE